MVEVMTPISLRFNISKTAGDSWLIQTDHLREIIHYESNGHADDDVT